LKGNVSDSRHTTFDQQPEATWVGLVSIFLLRSGA